MNYKERRITMKISKRFKMNVSAEKVDLYEWVTKMTPSDYVSFSKSHKAMGSYFKDGCFYMVNVETMGNEMIIQNYKLIEHRRDYTKLYSDKSRAFVWRWFPATVGVLWEMKVIPTGRKSSELECTIGADFSTALLACAAWINGIGGLFMRQHLNDEGLSFAKDIESKFSNGNA
jgi:hypothetical protein